MAYCEHWEKHSEEDHEEIFDQQGRLDTKVSQQLGMHYHKWPVIFISCSGMTVLHCDLSAHMVALKADPERATTVDKQSVNRSWDEAPATPLQCESVDT